MVYSSAPPGPARAILEGYARTSGVEVVPRFEAGGPGSVDLARLIVDESPRPRCDLLWSGEILATIRLRQRGMLAPWSPPNAAGIPASFRAEDGTWYGLAARARVFAVNTRLVAESDRPRGLADLVDPRWRGRAAIASPNFGSTATHFACLFAARGDEAARAFVAGLKANEVGVVPGNADVASAVGSGRFAFGLTDIGDAMAEVAAGRPVAIVYPDREAGQPGTLFLPDALAIPRGGPDPAGAEALGNALLGAGAGAKLARGTSARSPLGRMAQAPPGIETPWTIRAMDVDFDAAANLRDRVAAYLAVEFPGL